MVTRHFFAPGIFVLFLVACSGGGESSQTPLPPSTATQIHSIGVFVDSPVEGLQYRTATGSGLTNNAGEFKYLPGENVDFLIGDVLLGTALGQKIVTPVTLVPDATNAHNPVVLNIVRFLMTLDDDENPDNGISISEATRTAAMGINVDFAAPNFEAQPGLNQLLSQLPASPSFVDVQSAQTHFNTSLRAHSSWGSMVWGEGAMQSPDFLVP